MILAAAFLLFADGPAAFDDLRFAQLRVREQVMIRVTTRRPQAPSARPQPIEWKEDEGPKCVSARSIAGASMISQRSVDLLLRNRGRLRARLERRCDALDYYLGFYIKPGTDGQICADRDVIRSRVGGQCEIDAFRTLVPKPRKP